MYSRRHFLKLAGLLGLIPVALRAQDDSKDNNQDKAVVFLPQQIAVAQGVTDATSTSVSIIVHKSVNPTIKILDPQFSELSFEQKRFDFKLEGDFDVIQIFVDQLSLGVEYMLTVEDMLFPEMKIRYFKTLDLSNSQAKIALLSCSCHRDAGPKALMFQKLSQNNPDVIFFNGDLIYANSSLDTYLSRPAKPKDAYKMYIKSMMEFELYSQKNLVPIFATWDDHDLAYNNSDVSNPYINLYTKMFRAFFPADPRIQSTISGPGISFAFEGFGFQTFFLDTRSFKDKGNGLFLGDDQMIWLMEELPKSTLPKLFIFSQQLLYYSFIAESYERHAPQEFRHFISFCQRQGVPVMYITGDVHYSQIQELDASLLGYKTYEITSSAIFSSSARNFGKRKESEGQIAYYGYPNFLMLDQIKTDSKNIELRINCVSEVSDTQFTKNLKVSV